MPNFQWYCSRAANMTVAEMIYRFNCLLKSQQERLPAPLSPWISGADVDGGSRAFWRNTAATPTIWSTGPGAAFTEKFPREAKALRKRADEIVAGRLVLFGHEEVEWSRHPEWHRDPISHALWPRNQFYSSIDFRAGGAKCIWEPARHQHLATLAQAFAVLGDSRYRHYIYDQLQHWLENDVVARGVHWTSGIEIALRLISWHWIIACAPPDKDHECFRREWSAAIINSGTYLSRHLSRFSSANNHLVAEAVGLITASVLVPFWRTAARWRSLGWRILEEEVERQIHPDGVPAEQATHYLGFVIDLLLTARAVDPCWQSTHAINERLQRAGEFMLACSNDALELPVIGDHDSGYAFLAAGVPLDLRGRLGVLASIFGRGDFKSAAGPLTAAAWLFLTAAQRAQFDETAAKQTQLPSREFRFGGYSILRSAAENRPIIVFDCGPLGYPSIAAHGHADCLSFTLSLKDRWFLVDPGAYVYHEERVWRDYFRSTRAHNTLCVEGADQSRQTGPTMWGARARASHVAFKREGLCDWVEGEHDGYNKRSRPSIHRRGIALCRSAYIVIVDRLSCERKTQVSITFQFAPEAQVRLADSTIHANLADAELTLFPLFESSISIVKGRTDPPAGWVSPQFRLKHPAPAALINAGAQDDTPLVTVIWTGSAPLPILDQRREGQHLTISLRTAEWNDELVIRPSANRQQSMFVAFNGGVTRDTSEALRVCAV
jgi:hypothetical protein